MSAVSIGALLGWPSTARAANGVPYTDPAAQGVITLCDGHGAALTTGSTATAPFVGSATSVFTPPPAYRGAGRTATLYAYQPRQGVPAGQWSGSKLTSSSRYTGSQPTAVYTSQDPALDDFTQAFPPQVDGLIQLRLIESAPDEPGYMGGYPALDLKISADGSTWTAVESGDADCGQALATASEPTPVATAGASSSPTPARGAARTSSAARSPSVKAPASAAVPFVTSGPDRNVFGLVPGPSGTPVPVGNDDPAPDPTGPASTGGATGVTAPGGAGQTAGGTDAPGASSQARAGDPASSSPVVDGASATQLSSGEGTAGGLSGAAITLIALLGLFLVGSGAAVVVRRRRDAAQASSR